jgi:hypothetical protein
MKLWPNEKFFGGGGTWIRPGESTPQKSTRRSTRPIGGRATNALEEGALMEGDINE